jgi:hypothetical protein
MRARLFLGTLGVAGLTGAGLTVAAVRSPVTGPLTLLFLLFAPAVCVALLVPALDVLARVIVAGTAALALAAAIAEVMLVASLWSPRGGVIADGVACALLMAVAGLRRRRRADATGVAGSAAPDEDEDEDAWAFES